MWNVQNKHSGQQRLCKELLDSGNQRLCQKMHSGQQRLCPRLHSGQWFQLINKSASLWAVEIVQNCTLVNRDCAHICKFLGNSKCAQNCNLVDKDCVHKNVQVSGAMEIVHKFAQLWQNRDCAFSECPAPTTIYNWAQLSPGPQS